MSSINNITTKHRAQIEAFKKTSKVIGSKLSRELRENSPELFTEVVRDGWEPNRSVRGYDWRIAQ